MITSEEMHTRLKEYKDLRQFARRIRERLRNDWDAVIGITGPSGVGKSCFAYILGRLIDHNYTPEKNISFIPDPEEFERDFKKLNRFSVYHVDEAIRALHKLQFHNSMQQKLIHLYATERWRNICTFMLVPRFHDFTEQFRRFRIDIWIHIPARGHAFVYMRDEDKDTDDPWHTKENIKLKNRFNKKNMFEIDDGSVLGIERRTKCYYADFEFPNLQDLDPEGFEEYDRLKRESRLDEEKVAEKQELNKHGKLITQRDKAIHKLYEGGMKVKDIGELLGIAESTTRDAINRVKESLSVGENAPQTAVVNTPLLSKRLESGFDATSGGI